MFRTGRRRSTADGGASRREAVRDLRLPELPHLHRRRLARSLGAPDLSAEGSKNKGIALPDRPPQMPKLCEHGLADAVLCGFRRCEPAQARDFPRGLQRAKIEPCASSSGSRARRGARTRHASSRRSPHRTARSASAPRAPGYEVLATELYRDVAARRRTRSLARLIEPMRTRVTVYAERDWHAPYASGSAKVDAYVICPCSMGTLGTIASGRDVEPDPPRRLGRAEGGAPARSLCPRETPLSQIHLREHARRSTGRRRRCLFLAPGFYHGAATVDEPRRLRRRSVPRPARYRP